MLGGAVRRADSGRQGLLVIFIEMPLRGTYIIQPEPREDSRGFFARAWCQREFEAHGIHFRVVQADISFNKKRGTLRGVHYQTHPYEEAKLIRCTMGALYAVTLDLRPDSPTFRRHTTVMLSAENRKMLFIPEGLANGYQTLEDNTELFYLMSQFYAPEHARGIRWNDPTFRIPWPIADHIILERDSSYPDFVPPAGAWR